jgi:hypothetical protein
VRAIDLPLRVAVHEMLMHGDTGREIAVGPVRVWVWGGIEAGGGVEKACGDVSRPGGGASSVNAVWSDR